MSKIKAALLVLLLWAGAAFAFVPEQKTISPESLRAGMKGYLLTVTRGTEPVRLPLEIVSVIPQTSGIGHIIMIRLLPSPENRSGGAAQGMSGSPVYINGRIAGALASGWTFSDHNIAMVTPIEDMIKIFSKRDGQGGTGAARRSPISVSLSNPSALESSLGIQLETSPQGPSGELPVEPARFSPGDAVAAFLVWGDVEMAAVGTVTATSKDGKFLAFGHPFLGRGEVAFPAGKARVHETVYSQSFPFKIASPTSIAGTMTQDRAAGIGGQVGYFAPSIAAAFVLNDLDAGPSAKSTKNFRVVKDNFLSARLLSGVYSGLMNQEWGRSGEGTATVTLRVDGRGLLKGWTHTNLFFSDGDIGTAAVAESGAIIDTIMRQPFAEIDPIGFRLDVSVTREPKVLYIEDVAVSENAAPGGKLDVEVTLRPWRRRPEKKHFQLTVPEDAEGSCELVVRGGGMNSLTHAALDGGWKAIDGFERLLTEINAADANNELILELTHDGDNGDDDEKDDSPEEKEFLSETKARRLRDGTLKISRSEYFVEGMMKRVINLKDDGSDE